MQDWTRLSEERLSRLREKESEGQKGGKLTNRESRGLESALLRKKKTKEAENFYSGNLGEDR